MSDSSFQVGSRFTYSPAWEQCDVGGMYEVVDRFIDDNSESDDFMNEVVRCKLVRRGTKGKQYLSDPWVVRVSDLAGDDWVQPVEQKPSPLDEGDCV